jgi:hypothetical protein
MQSVFGFTMSKFLGLRFYSENKILMSTDIQLSQWRSMFVQTKNIMNNTELINIIVSQYRAALGALKIAVEKTPVEEWNTTEYNNPTWQLAYHTVWSVKFYLAPFPDSYVPFQNAIDGAESLGGSQDWENSESTVIIEGAHTKEEILNYIEQINESLVEAVSSLSFEANSGFEWYPYTRLELHINSIRHIQHHTAQIIERLKAKGITGFLWWADQNEPMDWS